MSTKHEKTDPDRFGAPGDMAVVVMGNFGTGVYVYVKFGDDGETEKFGSELQALSCLGRHGFVLKSSVSNRCERTHFLQRPLESK